MHPSFLIRDACCHSCSRTFDINGFGLVWVKIQFKEVYKGFRCRCRDATFIRFKSQVQKYLVQRFAADSFRVYGVYAFHSHSLNRSTPAPESLKTKSLKPKLEPGAQIDWQPASVQKLPKVRVYSGLKALDSQRCLRHFASLPRCRSVFELPTQTQIGNCAVLLWSLIG